MSEKSRGRRFNANWFVRIFDSKTRSWIWGRSVNVSVSGIMFLSPNRFSMGELIQMDITISPQVVVQCYVRVVRVGPPSASYYSYGAVYAKFERNGQQVISDTILSLIRSDWTGDAPKVPGVKAAGQYGSRAA